MRARCRNLARELAGGTCRLPTGRLRTIARFSRNESMRAFLARLLRRQWRKGDGAQTQTTDRLVIGTLVMNFPP